MKWIKNIRTTNTISFSIYFLLVLITVNGILDFSNRIAYQKHEAVVNEVKSAQVKMEMVVRTLQNADLGFRGYYIIPNDQLLDPFQQAVDSLPKYIGEMQVYMKNLDMDPKEVVPVEKAFQDYFDLIRQLVKWRKEGNTAAVDSVVTLDPGYAVWKEYDVVNKELLKKESAIIAKSKARTDKIMSASTTLRILLVVLGIPTLLVLLLRLRRDKKRREKLFHDLAANNRKYLFNPTAEVDQDLDEKKIIDSLIENLRKATGFISNIASGNYNSKWEGLNEENKDLNRENLVGELLQMREQMIKVKEEDQKRMWATEGVSRFSELVRKYQDNIQFLSDKITSEVVKYMGANQASLFFVVGKGTDEVALELSGCYAYDRKKFLEKKVLPGEGLVGQVYLEKEITYLTDIPQNYVRITSGLGDATPGSLVIVPLMFNESVEGILEIASFKKFQPYEMEFLNKIGEILASAIVTLRSSSEMKMLMGSLQEQSEEMKSQEEEMRQNMEELQATQEEMSRKAKEYQDVILEREKALEEKEQENEMLRTQLMERRN